VLWLAFAHIDVVSSSFKGTSPVCAWSELGFVEASYVFRFRYSHGISLLDRQYCTAILLFKYSDTDSTVFFLIVNFEMHKLVQMCVSFLPLLVFYYQSLVLKTKGIQTFF